MAPHEYPNEKVAPGFLSTDVPADSQHRKSSVTSIIGGGFTAANVLKLPVQTDDKSHLINGDSTTFASAGLDAYYRPGDQWEGLHRYNPNFTWEPAEETKLVRKVCISRESC